MTATLPPQGAACTGLPQNPGALPPPGALRASAAGTVRRADWALGCAQVGGAASTPAKLCAWGMQSSLGGAQSALSVSSPVCLPVQVSVYLPARIRVGCEFQNCFKSTSWEASAMLRGLKRTHQQVKVVVPVVLNSLDLGGS